MLLKRLFLCCCLSATVTGCAEFYASKTPAPVFEGAGAKGDYQPAAPEQTGANSLGTDTAVETKPLSNTAAIAPVEIVPEQLTPEQAKTLLTPEQEQELRALEQGQQPGMQETETPAPEAETKTETPAEPAPAVPKTTDAPAQPVAPPQPPPFEPLQTFAPQSPAVGALMLAANKSSEKGNIDSATTTIERAIRIEPRNASLYYKLAVLRLKQSKPGLAEDLAKKSALLASGNNQLKKHSWLLIAKAREMQNNPDGAKEARAKADKF